MQVSVFFRLALTLTLGILGVSAHAQTWPARPVHLTVANTGGSTPDVMARYLSTRLADIWKQPVVIDNRTGAGGILAADAVAKSAPDGYALLVGADGPITIIPNLQAGLPYNPLHDLVPVVLLGKIDFVLVANPKTGFRTLKDFIQAAKSRPGKLNYASAGNGSPQQLGMEMLKQRAGIYVTHIPYRGGPLGMQDVIGGQVDVMFIAIGPALPQIRSGRLVALAVSGDERQPLLSEVPTVAETYPGFYAGTWFGLFAPVRTPQAVIDTISADVGRIVREPKVRSDFAAQGIQATGFGPQAFGRQVAVEYERYARIVREVGIKGD